MLWYFIPYILLLYIEIKKLARGNADKIKITVTVQPRADVWWEFPLIERLMP